VVVQRREDLALLVKYLRSEAKDAFEILAVGVDRSERDLGVACSSVGSVTWLGYEPYAVGEWPLLWEGLERSPKLRSKWESRLNASGLLESSEACHEFERDYREVMGDAGPEPIADDPRLGVLALRIGRVDCPELGQHDGVVV
jgi:hypothetical protein